ncbi:unnamed protein product, partial [Owenia fusiformis]
SKMTSMGKTLILLHMVVITVIEKVQSQEEIRLVDEDNVYSGRVEINIKNKYWTICDDRWDSREAEVVCRQLGYPTGNVRAYHCSQYGSAGPGTKVAYRSFDCVGDELKLMDCDYLDAGSNCLHLEDVGVDCQAPGSEKDLVRLVEGNTPNTGKLQWRVNNTSPEWGTICSDSPWGINEATVACRQLGFPNGSAEAYTAGAFNDDPTKIWFSDISCSGSESNIMQCSVSNGARCSGLQVQCDHSTDVGLICEPESPEILMSGNSTSSVMSNANTSPLMSTSNHTMSTTNPALSTSNPAMATSN